MSTHVFFFGGWKCNVVNIKDWTTDAFKQKGTVTFDGFPYPDGATWDGEEAVKAFDIGGAVKKIKASTADKIFIVGHSSGCAISNEVDDRLSDHKKINLVVLDGYAPGNGQLERTNTQVWVAESGTGISLNHDKMVNRIHSFNEKAKNKQTVNVFTAGSGCTTHVALHFALVNLASSDALVKHVPDGYKNCSANMPWLP